MMTEFEYRIQSPRIINPKRIRSTSIQFIQLERGLVHRSLLYCLKKGYFTFVRFLLETGNGNIHERDQDGRTALIYCCFIKDSRWSENMATMLLEYGAQVEDQDKCGLNALHYAIILQRLVLVQRYLTSLNDCLRNSIDLDENTCLHHACSTGNNEIFQIIVQTMKRYSIDLSTRNKFGFTAYDIASQFGHLDFQKLLMEDLNFTDQNEQSKLTIATTFVSNVINDPLVEQRSSSIPAGIEQRASTSNSTHPGSLGSSTSFSSNVQHGRGRSSNGSSNRNEKIPSRPFSFVERNRLRFAPLKHNAPLDRSLVSQVKDRNDFVRPSTTNVSLTTLKLPSDTWRTDFSKVFWQLQSFKTQSYRPSASSLSQNDFVTTLTERSNIHSSSPKLDTTNHPSLSSTSTMTTQKSSVPRRNSGNSLKSIPKMKKVNFN